MVSFFKFCLISGTDMVFAPCTLSLDCWACLRVLRCAIGEVIFRFFANCTAIVERRCVIFAAFGATGIGTSSDSGSSFASDSLFVIEHEARRFRLGSLYTAFSTDWIRCLMIGCSRSAVNDFHKAVSLSGTVDGLRNEVYDIKPSNELFWLPYTSKNLFPKHSNDTSVTRKLILSIFSIVKWLIEGVFLASCSHNIKANSGKLNAAKCQTLFGMQRQLCRQNAELCKNVTGHGLR